MMPILTEDEIVVLLALEHFASKGVVWYYEDPRLGSIDHNFFPSTIPFWLLAVFVGGRGDVPTSNRILTALHGLVALGFVSKHKRFGAPSWLHTIITPLDSELWHMRCSGNLFVHVAVPARNEVVITWPDRPNERGWKLNYAGACPFAMRYATTLQGTRTARSLAFEPAFTLSLQDRGMWITVSAAAKLLLIDIPGLTLRNARARVSGACTAEKFHSNGMKRAARRIDPSSLAEWRIVQRDRELDKEDADGVVA